jgi:hypothetical protein
MNTFGTSVLKINEPSDSIDVSKYTNGLYYLILELENNERIIKKIIINK